MSLLTLKEASQFTKLSVHTLRNYIRANELSAVKLKRAVRIDESDLKQWLQANKGKREEVVIKKAKIKNKADL